MSELANKWWQWIYGIPTAQNPILDLTGVHCATQQSDRIWFLANSDSPQAVERKCIIPPDTSIFFPVINNLVYSPPTVEQTCDDAKDLAEFEINPNYIMTVILDGYAVQLDERNLIGSSECFDLLARIPSDHNPPSYDPSATDGYWFMFSPLSVGDHRLEILAQYNDTVNNEVRTMINVRYQLTVTDY